MNKLKLNIGWMVVLLFSIIPFILWIFTSKINVPFVNFQNSLVSLGQIFGLVGLVMFSINIILATRLKFLDYLFNGLNKVYEKHNILGQVAFILLLLHPLLLLPRYASNIREAFSFLFISNLWSRNFGIIALWMMIVLIILTLYLKPKYNLWKVTHKFFGIALFLASLHVYLIPGYIMNNLALKIYVLIFAILGIIAFLYRSVFVKSLIKTSTYIVEDVNKISKGIIEISLKPKNKKIKFRSGQFIFVSFKQKFLSSESHPFSISSSPKEEFLKITVKVLGDYTKNLYSKLERDTLVEIEGPFGTFSYNRYRNRNHIWIAGGIGITPFISFAKDLAFKNIDYSIQLFYCVRNRQEAIYLDLLNKLSQKSNNHFRVTPFYYEEKGYISVQYIMKNVINIYRKEIFICAPPKMIQALKTDLINVNILKSMIHSEEFNF